MKKIIILLSSLVIFLVSGNEIKWLKNFILSTPTLGPYSLDEIMDEDFQLLFYGNLRKEHKKELFHNRSEQVNTLHLAYHQDLIDKIKRVTNFPEVNRNQTFIFVFNRTSIEGSQDNLLLNLFRVFVTDDKRKELHNKYGDDAIRHYRANSLVDYDALFDKAYLVQYHSRMAKDNEPTRLILSQKYTPRYADLDIQGNIERIKMERRMKEAADQELSRRETERIKKVMEQRLRDDIAREAARPKGCFGFLSELCDCLLGLNREVIDL